MPNCQKRDVPSKLTPGTHYLLTMLGTTGGCSVGAKRPQYGLPRCLHRFPMARKRRMTSDPETTTMIVFELTVVPLGRDAACFSPAETIFDVTSFMAAVRDPSDRFAKISGRDWKYLSKKKLITISFFFDKLRRWKQ